MGALCDGLVGSRQSDHAMIWAGSIRRWASRVAMRRNPGPTNGSMPGPGHFWVGGAALARWRMMVIMAKASMTSETCHPRSPSGALRLSRAPGAGVPCGYHVARLPPPKPSAAWQGSPRQSVVSPRRPGRSDAARPRRPARRTRGPRAQARRRTPPVVS